FEAGRLQDLVAGLARLRVVLHLLEMLRAAADADAESSAAERVGIDLAVRGNVEERVHLSVAIGVHVPAVDGVTAFRIPIDPDSVTAAHFAGMDGLRQVERDAGAYPAVVPFRVQAVLLDALVARAEVAVDAAIEQLGKDAAVGELRLVGRSTVAQRHHQGGAGERRAGDAVSCARAERAVRAGNLDQKGAVPVSLAGPVPGDVQLAQLLPGGDQLVEADLRPGKRRQRCLERLVVVPEAHWTAPYFTISVYGVGSSRSTEETMVGIWNFFPWTFSW